MKRVERIFPLAIAMAYVLLVTPENSQATEPLFANIYTTDVLPQGAHEFEQWLVTKRGKASGDYTSWLLRTEVEFGITENFQIAPYINFAYYNAYRTTVDGRTEAEGVPEDFSYNNPFSRYRDFRYDSVSLEAIYRLRNALTDDYGLAFYLEPSVGPGMRELESKLLFQKNFAQDRWIFAANLGLELESNHKSGVSDQLVIPGEDESAEGGGVEEEEEDELQVPRWEKNTEISLDMGLSYLFAPRWRASFEVGAMQEYGGYSLAAGKREHTTWFAGPTLNYGAERWFVTVSYRHQLPYAQLGNFEAEEYGPEIIGDRLYASERERNEVYIRVGFPF